MALAGVGAICLNHESLGGSHLELSAGSSIGAGVLSSSNARDRAISRDSDRLAAAGKANRALQREAEQQNAQRSATLTSLARSAKARSSEIAKNQWGLPTEGYHLTARFGQVSGLWQSFHTGLDFAAPTGTPIFAIAGGVITSVGWDGSYGQKTVETLPDGTQLWYAHQSYIGVHAGEKVTEGETIGKVGATGNTTGPHVHIEVRPHGGDPVNPYPEFVEHGVTP